MAYIMYNVLDLSWQSFVWIIWSELGKSKCFRKNTVQCYIGPYCPKEKKKIWILYSINFLAPGSCHTRSLNRGWQLCFKLSFSEMFVISAKYSPSRCCSDLVFIFHFPEGPVDVFSLGLHLMVVTMMMRLMGIVMMIALLIVMIMIIMRMRMR